MSDVNFCVIGAGFAGMSAAFRLKQAGRRDMDRPGRGVDRPRRCLDPHRPGLHSYRQNVDGKAMMIIDGKQHRYSGTIPPTWCANAEASPWG
jgi:monoamine oxidase